MRLFAAPLLLLFALPVAAPADDKKPAAAELKAKIAALRSELAALEAQLARLEPAAELKWEKGGRGVLPLPPNTYYVALRVVARDEMEVVLVFRGVDARGARLDTRHGDPFVVKGVPTAGVKAKSEITLKGEFRVTGDRVAGGSSLWVVEPVKK